MLDFNTGDDFNHLVLENVEDIDYIAEWISSENNQLSSSPIQVASSVVDSPEKRKRKRAAKQPIKKRIRILKGSWVCNKCNSTFCNKQSLDDHMDNIRICQKKQKRLEERSITLDPHDDLGSTLQTCIDTLRDHQRLNDSQAKIRLSLIIIYI